MTNVYSSADVRDMDRAAIESGIPGLELMDAAARRCMTRSATR